MLQTHSSHQFPRVKSRARSHVQPTLVVPMQTRKRQEAALLAIKPVFANDDLLSLIIEEALPAAALHAVTAA